MRRQGDQQAIERTSGGTWAQVSAGLNGAGDAVTLGLGDPIGAAAGAVIGLGHGNGLANHYQSIRERQADQDRFDAIHYPLARDIGLGVGTGAVLLASDGVAAVPAGVRLAPQTVRLLGSRLSPSQQMARVTAASAGAGSGAGLLGQFVADLANDRPASPAELAGAGVGGAAAGPAMLWRGPGTAAAIEALVNHGVQSVLHREPLPWEMIRHDAAAGAAFGMLAGKTAAGIADSFNFRQKGPFGELLSEDGGSTRADHLLAGATEKLGRGVEAKFGDHAELSTAQKFALRTLGPLGRYYVDHFRPADIARGFGG